LEITAWAWQDTLTLSFFFAALIAIVIYVMGMKEETTADYFLAGRNATWVVIGASIFASNIGSEHVVGLAGAGASTGMAMAHWELHGYIILVLGWVFVPFYSRSMVYTMPEFLEKRFSAGSRSFLSIISLVSYVLTKVAVTVYAGGIVFKQVLGIDEFMGIDFFWIGAVGLVVATGIYTVVGGMKSVLYTSLLQTPVLLMGSILIVIIGLIELGGWGELEAIAGAATTPEGDSLLSLIRSPNDETFPWTGVLFASPIIGFWYWCTDQYIVQRVLTGRDQREARRGTIFGAYLKLTPVFIFLVPGLIAFALNEKGLIDLPNADAAFPVLVATLLPVGFKGIVVGGLVAALMSSLASLFNSSALLFTVDFYKKWQPQASEERLVYVGRIATVVVVILGVLWIPVMRGLGDVLYVYLQDVQSLLAPGIAAVFVLGVFWRGTTAAGSLSGLFFGFTFGMSRLALRIFESSAPTSGLIYDWIVSPNWLHYCIGLFLASLTVIILVSLFTEKPRPEQLQGLTYGSATPEQQAETRASWNHWDVIHTCVILSFIGIFYAYFW
jgi:SSS family solute:Na+ symporter